MRNYFLFFLFAAFVSGCGRSGPAKPPQAEALEAGNFTEPTGGGAASDVPDGAGRDTQTVQVRVEQVEMDVDDQEEEEEEAFDVDRKTGRKVARVSSRTIAVKVEVMNGYRAVRVLVSATPPPCTSSSPTPSHGRPSAAFRTRNPACERSAA